MEPALFGIEVAHQVGATVVTVRGEIDLATAPKLRSALVEALASSPRTLRVDLGGVSFLDSSGISVLVEVQQRLTEAGATLVLHGLHDQTSRVLEIAGLTEFFRLSDEPALES